MLLRREEGRKRIAGCEEPSHIYNVYIYIQTDELPTPIFFHLISLRDRIRELLILRILPLHPVGDIRRNALFQIRHTLHRLAPDGEVRHDARPHPLPHGRVGEILAVLPRGAGPDLGARAPDRDAQDAGAPQLRGGGVAGVGPAGGDEVVGDELHGVQAFGFVRHDVRVPEDDGAAVVARVVVRGQGEDYAVELRGADADRYPAAAAVLAAVAGGWGVAVCVGGPGEAEDPRGDVAVEVDYTAFALVRAEGVGVGARAAEHGEDDGEGRVALLG